MADGFSVDVKVDPPNLLQGALLERVFLAAEAAMEAIGAHAAERGQANAPIKSGDLRRSIKHSVKRDGENVTATIVATEPYALRMHEELTPAGPLNLGPISAIQPTTPEGGVGGKFFTRVLDFHADPYTRFLRDAVRAGLSAKDAKKITVKRITS